MEVPISTRFTEKGKQELDCLMHSQKLSRDVPDPISTVPSSEIGSFDSMALSPPARSQLEDRIARRSELTPISGLRVKSGLTETRTSVGDGMLKCLPQGVGDIQAAAAHDSGLLGALQTSSGHKQCFGTDVLPIEASSKPGAPEQLFMLLNSLTISKEPSTSFAAENHDEVLKEQTEHIAFEPSVTSFGQSANPDKLAGRETHYMVSPPTLLERTRQVNVLASKRRT